MRIQRNGSGPAPAAPPTPGEAAASPPRLPASVSPCSGALPARGVGSSYEHLEVLTSTRPTVGACKPEPFPSGSPTIKIGTLLDRIDLGELALPEFQRGYVWNRTQVRGLMTSLYRRHPVGSLLVWLTRTEDARARGDGEFRPGVVSLLLDGQQRITSLYGIMRSLVELHLAEVLPEQVQPSSTARPPSPTSPYHWSRPAEAARTRYQPKSRERLAAGSCISTGPTTEPEPPQASACKLPPPPPHSFLGYPARPADRTRQTPLAALSAESRLSKT